MLLYERQPRLAHPRPTRREPELRQLRRGARGDHIIAAHVHHLVRVRYMRLLPHSLRMLLLR